MTVFLGRLCVSRTCTAGVSPAAVEHYVYSGNQVAADLDGNGNLLRSYTWGPGIDNLLSITVHPQTTNAQPQTYCALKDHQNSVIALVDAAGNVVESYAYDAYGRTTIFDSTGTEIANHQSAIGNRYLWQGREYDAATGLYYFRARWYSPETGRWLSKDPIGISGGLNLYVFCGNNPVNFIDPFGLLPPEGSVDVVSYHDTDGDKSHTWVEFPDGTGADFNDGGAPVYTDAASRVGQRGQGITVTNRKVDVDKVQAEAKKNINNQTYDRSRDRDCKGYAARLVKAGR